MSKSADVDRLFEAANEAMGGVDVLINNAGVAGPTKRVEDISDEEWRSTIGVDVDGQFYCARRAVPLMREAGKGAIINISSTAGRLAFPLRLPYATAKRAVIGLTDTLAMELGPRNISVNAVLPGYVLNDRARLVLQAKADASERSYDEIKDIFEGVVQRYRRDAHHIWLPRTLQVWRYAETGHPPHEIAIVYEIGWSV